MRKDCLLGMVIMSVFVNLSLLLHSSKPCIRPCKKVLFLLTINSLLCKYIFFVMHIGWTPVLTCLNFHAGNLGAWLHSCNPFFCSRWDVDRYYHPLVLPRRRGASRDCTICTSPAHGNTRWPRRDAATNTRLLSRCFLCVFHCPEITNPKAKALSFF